MAADRARALALAPVSRETLARLDAFVALLLKWQKTTNLIAPSTIPELWTRHVADSLQLLPLAGEARVWVDLGSGGGFPGLVIACVLKERPGTQVNLVESNEKKAAFLREAVRETGAPAVVHAMRIEDFVRKFEGPVDIVTARALAPLDRLLPMVAPLLKSGAKAILPKGQDIAAELTAAAKCWNIEAQQIPSKTSGGGKILVLSALRLRKTT